MRIYLKLDLLQSSHEIHHLPVINLFQELIEFLNRQRDDDILRNFPTNLKLTLEEFSKLDFCKELEKLLKNLNKKIIIRVKKKILKETVISDKKYITTYKDIKKYFKYFNKILFKDEDRKSVV